MKADETQAGPVRVGVISDTHGLLRPAAIEALEGSDLIVHAGDVGPPAVLERLREIAPVRAVRGNTDRGPFGASLPESEVVDVGGVTLYVRHIADEIDLDPAAAGFDAVVFGHSHRPEVRRARGVLWLNPGSAGPRRFDLPVTLARLVVRAGEIAVESVDLATDDRR